MAFWKRGGRSQEQDGLNALDRATKSMAVSASRRGFLKKLPALGAGLGLGLGGIQIAFGRDGGGVCHVDYTDPERDGCCGPHNAKQRWKRVEVTCCPHGCGVTNVYNCSDDNCIS